MRFDTPEKKMPGGLRPHTGQMQIEMAVFVQRVAVFFKTELAIFTGDGDDNPRQHPHTF